MRNLSIIIPVFNEEENIEAVHREVVDACEANGYEYEIIIIDDGSSDRTGKIAEGLSPVKLVRFTKNYGQTSAIDAGIKLAKNDYIITMDGDRQNDPNDIPNMLKYLEDNNLDLVSGWRHNRKDKVGKKFTSRGANILRSCFIKDGIHDSGCTLKIYKRNCLKNVNLYGEMHRFIPALLKIKGYEIGEVKVNHRPRVSGESKYDWKRTIKGFIDIISVWFWKKYAVRPLHLLGGGGLFLLFGGFICMLYTIYLYMRGDDISNTAFPILSSFLIVAGVQLFISGLLADIILKIYFEKTSDAPYTIKEKIQKDHDK